MKAIVSWSGGKDSCFACYKALTQGYEVSCLLNFISREFRRVSAHGTRARLISQQAKAVGIPLVQCTVPADMSLYEQIFKKAVSHLKRSGMTAIVFGDIYLEEHRDWIERVCDELGITPILPLWGMPPEDVLGGFIEAGFQAVTTSARADVLDETWVGRSIGHSFLSDLEKLQQERELDVCGERGEYHTLVVDGPLFWKRLELTCGAKSHRDGCWFLDIPRCRLESKEDSSSDGDG